MPALTNSYVDCHLFNLDPLDRADGPFVIAQEAYDPQDMLMQDTVWTINPKNDNIQKLFDRMESFASGVLSSQEIGFDFKVETDLGQVNFTMDQRKSIYLIFKEAINNIVKHAEASMVWVHVSRSKDTIHIGIEDNGKGFDVAEESNGNGLANFRDRADEAGIQLFIESEKGKGTRLKTDIAL